MAVDSYTSSEMRFRLSDSSLKIHALTAREVAGPGDVKGSPAIDLGRETPDASFADLAVGSPAVRFIEHVTRLSACTGGGHLPCDADASLLAMQRARV